MKKIYLLFIVAGFLFACSSDDSNSTPETYRDFETVSKTISIVDNCDAPDQGSYCVTDQTYQTIYNQVLSSEEPCQIITFNDIDGVERSGYFRTMGETNNGCIRNTNP